MNGKIRLSVFSLHPIFDFRKKKMNARITRRQFLGSSMILTAFPAALWAAENVKAEDVALRYAVISDVHFSENPDSKERKRLIRALEFLGKSHFDALVVAGDMTNHGYTSELTLFRDTLLGGLPKETQLVICMGNHEFYGGKDHEKAGGGRPHWQGIFQRPLNPHVVINGFHFIGISPDDPKAGTGTFGGSREWLREQLKAASAEDPKRPIVVFQHHHVSETVYGSCGIDHWGVPDLRPVLDEFPQVIDYSGHSHYPSNDPRSAWQGNFTAFGTSTLSYYEMTGGIFEKFPEGYSDAAQMYVVEVMKDYSSHLRIYDVLTDSFFDTEFLVAEPGNIEKYCYTDERYKTAAAPYWKGELELKISDVNPYGAVFTFPQAFDEMTPKAFVGSYQMTFEQKTKDGWELAGEANPWSKYYFREMPEELAVEYSDLEPDGEYRVEIRARNAFGKLSEKVLTGEFQTAKGEEEAIDRDAPKPAANVVNFFVAADGAFKNEPEGGKFPAALETRGTPKAQDGWAVFDGQKDQCIVKFGEKDYARLRRRITMACRFQFDGFKEKGAADIFANTEQGGTAFELNHERKELEFWCSVSGRYVIIRTPITPGAHTAFGVYDGQNVILYLDGKEAAKTQAKGFLTYPKDKTAHAYSIGSDIGTKFSGGTFFEGKVQFARVFSWALSPEQVKNLTEE